MRTGPLRRPYALAVVLPVLAIVGCHGGERSDASPPAASALVCAPCQAGLRGDLNGNGLPDVADAIGILRIVVGLEPANALADCDRDGATGVGDAIALLRCVVGLDEWPIGGGSATIGPDGGTVATSDGSVTLDVPAGALQAESDLTISPQATCPAGDGLVPGTCYDFGPEGTQFCRPVQLTIAYDETDLPTGSTEADLAIYRAAGEQWQPVVGSVVDAGANTVSAQVSGFSAYAVLGQVEEPELGDEAIGPDGQTLVWVPSGSFPMGSNGGESDEQPVHQVTLDGFWIGECEITSDQYAAFLNAARPADPDQWVDITIWCSTLDLVEGSYRSKPGRGQHPVGCANWYGAVAYCAQYGYALPTEAQWEYAARGPGGSTYPWGDEWDAQKCCNWDNKPPDDFPYAVGSFPAGASWCGALDMAGNVWEWCADWYGGDYYQASPEVDPPGPESGSMRVLRGGGVTYDIIYCRAAYRGTEAPHVCYHGFRATRSR